MLDVIFPVLLPFAFFFVLLLFVAMRSAICPGCGAKFSGFQSPLARTKGQWIEGVNTCQKCGCKVDAAGKQVSDGMPLRIPVRVFVSVAASLGLAAILVFFILQR